jgi:hypothetical protein
MTAANGPRFLSLAKLPAIAGLGAAVLVTAAVVATNAPSGLAASTKADFSLTASPSSASAQQGQAATYTITESKLNGFKDPVALTASNLPSGTSATFSPQTLDSKITSTVVLQVGASTLAATYSNITFTGTGGGVSHAVTVALTVTAAPQPSFALTATPASATMLPGDTAAYSVGTSSINGFSGAISFSVVGAPAGATATFSPASVPVGGSSNLQVATKNSSAAGNYSLTITGTSGTKTQSATVQLVLTGTGKQFSITAPAVVVGGPGASQPLNLSLSNPNNQALSITNVTIAVQSVSKAAGAVGPCTPADFSVTQLSGGSYPLAVPAGQTRALSTLVPNSAQWPRLAMLNSSQNQDGCKGASIALSFSGAGQG